MPNSGTLVLPIGIAPAARSRSTSTLSSAGITSRKIVEPRVHGNPTAGSSSLKAMGRPCRGPMASPRPWARASRRSASSASARQASSSSLATMALILGLIRSMRARCAAISSRAETRRAAIRRASSRALAKQRSVVLDAAMLMLFLLSRCIRYAEPTLFISRAGHGTGGVRRTRSTTPAASPARATPGWDRPSTPGAGADARAAGAGTGRDRRRRAGTGARARPPGTRPAGARKTEALLAPRRDLGRQQAPRQLPHDDLLAAARAS